MNKDCYIPYLFIFLLLLGGCGGESDISDNEDPTTMDDAGQPVNETSGGLLILDDIRVSRVECTSPCPVIFSIDTIEDSTAINPFTDTGVFWDYDDDSADERNGQFTRGAQYFLAGRVANSGASRESDTNTPLGMHTYECDSDTCIFYPGVSVQNVSGDWATAWTTITVHAADTTFPTSNIICYAIDNDFTDCPEGANQVISSTMPLRDEWASNTRYLFRRGDIFSSAEGERGCIVNDRENILIDSFGSGTPAEFSADFVIGADGSCTDVLVSDVQALAYTVPNWIRNITVSNLRLPSLRLGITFSDVTFHNLDMDYEFSTAGGGRIIMENSNYCSNNTALDCTNVPLPKGLYLTGVDIVGSRTVIPGMNMGLLPNSCVSFLGLIDVSMGVAFEHNLRVECSSRTAILHSDFNGDHIGTNGNKHAITLRPEGYLQEDMLLSGIRRSSDTAQGGPANIYEDRFSAIKGVYLGTPESVNNASRISVAPSNAQSTEVTRYSLVSASVTDMSGGSGDGPPNRDVNFAGWGLTCYDDNQWETVNGCGDGSEGVIPAGGFEPSRTISAPLIPLPPWELQNTGN